MELPKVLVATPTYSGKHYIFPRWYHNVTKNLTYPNYDWIIVDNTKSQSYITKLRREGYRKVHGVPRRGNSRIALGQASEYIRNYAIKNNFDYIMWIESDLLPPPNIIERLLAHKKPIVGAVYEIGFDWSKDSPRRPLIYHVSKSESGEEYLDILPRHEGYSMLNRGLIRTPAMGLGCCLMHKDIFTQYPFKYSKNTKLHTDSIFYYELWKDKVEVWVDSDIVIYHENQNWKDVKDW